MGVRWKIERTKSMSRNESSRIEYWFFMLTLYVFVVLVIYACHFHACKLSNCTTDWGAFGSYFGGMVSIVSIILLYLTLREQHKENYRLRIETGFERIHKATWKKYKLNKEQYDSILEKMYKAIEEQYNGKQEEAKKRICELYADKQNVILIKDIYQTFSYLARGIQEEEDLPPTRKYHYLQNLVCSEPNSILAIILVHLFYGTDTETYDTDEENMRQLFRSDYIRHYLFDDRLIKTPDKDDMGKAVANYVFAMFNFTNNKSNENKN